MIIAPDDYPGKKYRNRYCYEHHFVWWQNTGLIISGNQVIHHKNMNTHDNRFENLVLSNNSEHSSHHNNLRADKTLNAVCSHCSKKFRVRPYKLKNPLLFCSRECIGLYNFKKRSNRRS